MVVVKNLLTTEIFNKGLDISRKFQKVPIRVNLNKSRRKIEIIPSYHEELNSGKNW